MSTVFELVKIKVSSSISSMLLFMKGKKSSDNKGFSIGTAIILAIIIIAFLFMMIFVFGLSLVLGFQMRIKGCEWFYFPLASIVALAFSLLGSVFAAQSYLFEATDNDLLLSMPIKPSAVLLSRMLALFFLNLVYCCLILIPVGIAYGMMFHFGFISGLCYVLSLIFVPALCTGLSCIFGYFLGILSNKVPNKNLIAVACGFGMLAVLVAICVSFGDIINNLLNEIDSIAAGVAHYAAVLYWYGCAANGNGIVGILPILLISGGIPTLVFLFLSSKFTSIITRKAVLKKKKYVAKPMKPSNMQLALIKKEVAYFLSIPGYVMNAGMSTVMAFFLGITIILRGEEIVGTLPTVFPDAASSLMPLAVGSSLALCCTMNDVTAPSISLEGKTLWILKSTPLNVMSVFIGKAVLAPIVSLPGIVFTSIVSGVCLELTFFETLFIILTPILACLFSGFLGVCINLKMPRFDWGSEIQVIKQSLSVVFTLLLAVFFTAIPFIFAIIPAAYLDYFSAVWSYTMCILYFVVLIALEVFYLATDGKKIFEKL